MSDEITVVAQVSVDNSPYVYRDTSQNFEHDQATAGGTKVCMDVGTSEEDIDFGDVDAGWCKITNLDDAIPIQIGKKDGSGNMQAMIECPPLSEQICYRPSGTTWRTAAPTAATLTARLIIDAHDR
jgi:hypothetical protein